MTAGPILLASFLLLAADDPRDRLVLKDGRTLRGRVLLERDDRIRFLAGTRAVEVPREEIESCESVARAQAQWLARFGALEQETPEALLELAEFCRAEEVVHDEALLYWRILALDPGHAIANERLGHRRGPKGWMAPAGARGVPVERLDEYRSDWARAWELRSEHFAVRCDRGLRETTDTLLELESLYRAFYDLYQRLLGYPELTEPIPVHVYRSREAYPSLGSHVGAYFSREENILYTYFDGKRPFALFHEGTHGLLHNLMVRAAGSKGGFPCWLDEAWADHMEAIVVPVSPGRTRVEPSRLSAARIAAIGGEEEPFSLHRVLNFQADDYQASTRQALKYGQGYALFRFLMEDSALYRERFLGYVREAMAGRGQASTFRRIFRRDLDDLERAYLDGARGR